MSYYYYQLLLVNTYLHRCLSLSASMPLSVSVSARASMQRMSLSVTPSLRSYLPPTRLSACDAALASTTASASAAACFTLSVLICVRSSRHDQRGVSPFRQLRRVPFVARTTWRTQVFDNGVRARPANFCWRLSHTTRV